jgi:DNA-binding NarL/FixJ family response regulator
VTIKVLLADDHQIIRDGLRSLLTNEPDIEVVGEANDGRAAVEMTQRLKPDIVVMDITMPGLNGIEATRQVRAISSDIKVLALSMHADKRFVAGVLHAGASGYVLKNCAFRELIQAIHTVAVNQTYLSPTIADIVVESYVRHSPLPASPLSVLTPREREVLQLIAEGLTLKKIAATLCVSPKTIETHREQIMRKLNASSVAELTKYAVREGLTSLED